MKRKEKGDLSKEEHIKTADANFIMFEGVRHQRKRITSSMC
jgi:hypothetical protein